MTTESENFLNEACKACLGKRWERAKYLLHKALKADKRSSDALHGLGVLYLHQNKHHLRAIILLERAFTLLVQNNQSTKEVLKALLFALARSANFSAKKMTRRMPLKSIKDTLI